MSALSDETNALLQKADMTNPERPLTYNNNTTPTPQSFLRKI
jgi:hypothetical protein